MTQIPNSNNIKLINDIFSLLDSKVKYRQYIEDLMFRLPDFTEALQYKMESLNELTELYKYKLFPIIELKGNDIIAIYQCVYVIINMDITLNEFEVNCTFKDANDLWIGALVNIIESNYNIKIEE